jgi:hypothetical protein
MLAYNTSKNITTYDAKNTLSKLTKVRKGSNPTTHHYPRSNTCTERNKTQYKNTTTTCWYSSIWAGADEQQTEIILTT